MKHHHNGKTQDKTCNEIPLHGHTLPLRLRGFTQWNNTFSGLITIWKMFLQQDQEMHSHLKRRKSCILAWNMLIINHRTSEPLTQTSIRQPAESIMYAHRHIIHKHTPLSRHAWALINRRAEINITGSVFCDSWEQNKRLRGQ